MRLTPQDEAIWIEHRNGRLVAENRAREQSAIGRYLARLNNVRATPMERLRRWWRRVSFGAIK